MKQVQFIGVQRDESRVRDFLDRSLTVHAFLAFTLTDDRLVFQCKVADPDLSDFLYALEHADGFSADMASCSITDIYDAQLLGTSRRRPVKAGSPPYIGMVAGKSPAALWLGQVFANVQREAVLSLDACILLAVSSIVAGIGLATDDRAYVVASMLMSPLMGPLLACSFGLAVHDHDLFVIGVRNEALALLATILLGFLLGIIFGPFAPGLYWPTQEMAIRGVFAELLFGAIVAICGGIAVAISETNALVSSIVGIAIAAALLPPAVNTGLCLAYANIGSQLHPQHNVDVELFNDIAAGSFTLVLVNVFFVYTSAALVFKAKMVRASKPRDARQRAGTLGSADDLAAPAPTSA